MGRHDVLVGDVHAAGEGERPVHDQRLLVRAQVDERHAPGQERVHEARSRHALAPQPVVGARQQPTAADPVNKDPHLDAAPVGAGQCIGEPAAPDIGAEDIG